MNDPGAGPRGESESTDDEADKAARESAQQAEESADDAQASADDAQEAQREVEDRSDEFLSDSPAPGQIDQSYGTLGAPLKRHSPFYIGFFGAVGALLAIWLGQQILSISSVLILIVVAMFLAVGLNPLVEFFMHRGAKRSHSVVIVIIGVLGTLALFVIAIAPVISDQVTALTNQAPVWLDNLQHNKTAQRLDEQYGIVGRAQDYITSGGWADRVFGGVVGVGVAVLSVLLNAFIVTVLTLYFLASLPNIKQTAYRFAPASRRPRVTALGDQILANVGGYVSGAFIVAMCAGVSSLIFLFIVGLGEYAVALAVVVALLDVIPMIGATLGAVIVTAIGFATDVRTGVICLVFYVVYQQLENYGIYPRVMSRSVDLSGAVIVIAALVGAGLLGVVGALLAIPTAAAIQLLLKELFLRRQDAH